MLIALPSTLIVTKLIWKLIVFILWLIVFIPWLFVFILLSLYRWKFSVKEKRHQIKANIYEEAESIMLVISDCEKRKR